MLALLFFFSFFFFFRGTQCRVSWEKKETNDGLYIHSVTGSQGQVGWTLTQGMPPHSKGVIEQLTIEFLTPFCLWERETIPKWCKFHLVPHFEECSWHVWFIRVVIIMGHQEGREFYIKEINCSAYQYCDYYYYWILLASPVRGGARDTAEHVVGMLSPGVVVK
jgi:hypothetical protein